NEDQRRHDQGRAAGEFEVEGRFTEALQQEGGQRAVLDGEHGGGEYLVPGNGEGEYGRRGDAGPRQRQDGLSTGVPTGAAERPSRRIQVTRNPGKQREGHER